MERLQLRLYAMQVIGELPPTRADAEAVLDEARRLVVGYLFEDSEADVSLRLGGSGGNVFPSKSAS